MSYALCPDCNLKIEVFGESRVEALAAAYGIPNTARLPIDPKLTSGVDHGGCLLYRAGRGRAPVGWDKNDENARVWQQRLRCKPRCQIGCGNGAVCPACACYGQGGKIGANITVYIARFLRNAARRSAPCGRRKQGQGSRFSCAAQVNQPLVAAAAVQQIQ